LSDRKEKDKQILQNTKEKSKDRATRFPLQTGREFDCSLMHFFQIIVTVYLNEKYKYIYTVKPASNALDIEHTFYIKCGDIL
jgi:hypothetical protein